MDIHIHGKPGDFRPISQKWYKIGIHSGNGRLKGTRILSAYAVSNGAFSVTSNLTADFPNHPVFRPNPLHATKPHQRW